MCIWNSRGFNTLWNKYFWSVRCFVEFVFCASYPLGVRQTAFPHKRIRQAWTTRVVSRSDIWVVSTARIAHITSRPFTNVVYPFHAHNTATYPHAKSVSKVNLCLSHEYTNFSLRLICESRRCALSAYTHGRTYKTDLLLRNKMTFF